MFKEFFKKAYIILKGFKKAFLVLFGLIVIKEVLQLVQPYLFKEIIDSITDWQNSSVEYILLLIGAMFLMYLLSTGHEFFVDRKIFRILYDMELYLLTQAQKKLVELSLGYHEKENTGAKISKIQRGVGKIVDLFGNLSWDMVPTLVQVVVTTVFMLFLDWQISLIFFSVVPVFMAVTFYMNKKARPLRIKRHDIDDDSYGRMGQSVININTVQSYAQGRRELSEYGDLRKNYKKTGSKEYQLVLRLNIIRELAINIGRALVLLASLYKVVQGDISVGSLVMFLTLSEKTYFSLFRISRIYDRVADASTAVRRLFILLGKKSEVVEKQDARQVREIQGSIKFDHVHFHYIPSEPVLKDLDFTVEPAETIALVGPSGGGKSTIVKLLLRHYDVVSGKIILDGKDVRDLKIDDFRKFVGYVSQDVEIFSGSVKENIAYGQPDASFEEVRKAAERAYADEFINQFSDGYDAVVGERGVKLSGGQKQRIGIARAILRKPRILLFDEATSSLDTISEKLIQKSIEEISRESTMIIIAHRLSTITHADRILVIEDGRVVEEGDHETLKARGRLYAKLLRLQATGEVR
ncbi:MAG: ABC transporter ATP-binding protein [Patescibacteria group bacterium]